MQLEIASGGEFLLNLCRFTRRKLWFTLLLAGPIAAAQSAAVVNQFPQSEIPTLKMTTRLVVLDVVATDKAGHIVPDLARQDFTVYEDKQPQTILTFEAPAQHLLTPGVQINSTAELVKAPDAPVTLLVLDELNTRFGDMAFARHALEKYLKSQPSELVQPTALLVAGNTKFQVLEDYTRDRQAILAALDKHFPDYPWRLMQSGKSGPGAAERLAMSLGALQQIAQAATGHPGRKNVIWVGCGFPAVNVNESTDKEAVVIQNAVEQTIDAMRDARITLSTINPTINSTDTVDMETPADLDVAADENGSDPFTGSVNFQLLAPATGGRVYFSRNDVAAEIGASGRDGSQFYTLSYSPANHNDMTQPYRRIRVTVDRPGVTATTRNGYYIQTVPSATPETAQAARQVRSRLAFDLGSAANSNIAYTGLPSTVRRLAGGKDEFVVQVDTRALTWRDLPDGSRQAEVTLAVASFGRKRKMLARTVREVTARLSTTQTDATLSSNTGFAITAEIPADATRVRFVVRDAASGKMGTVDFDPARGR